MENNQIIKRIETVEEFADFIISSQELCFRRERLEEIVSVNKRWSIMLCSMLRLHGSAITKEQIISILATMVSHSDYLNGEFIDEKKVVEV